MPQKLAIDERTPATEADRLWSQFWSKERTCKPYQGTVKAFDPIRQDHVRVVCISDTHTKLGSVLHRVPEGDVLVHCGDFTNNGETEEIRRFDEQMATLMHPHKFVVAGNHELGFDDTEDLSKRYKATAEDGTPKGYELLKNCTPLHDKLVEVYGLRFYGSSWHPLAGYAFSRERGNDLAECWSRVPDNVDVLLTHTPPLGHLDVFRDGEHWGCAELLNVVEKRAHPKFHIFGHVHEKNGMTTNGETVFINASICDHKLNPRFDPIVFDIPLPNGQTKA